VQRFFWKSPPGRRAARDYQSLAGAAWGRSTSVRGRLGCVCLAAGRCAGRYPAVFPGTMVQCGVRASTDRVCGSEVREYAGWCRHRLTGMLAHFFLGHLKLRLGKKSASAYGLPSAKLTCLWPLQPCPLEDVLGWVKDTHRRNHAVYLVRRKRYEASG
jgi:hypothetical protein